MSFFDQEPAPPEPPQPEYRPPEWSAPPENVMPAAVALDAMIVSRDGVAVWIDAAFVYPTGVAFQLTIMRRERPPRSRHGLWFIQPDEDEAGGPRFGVGFSDGRKATMNRSGFGDHEPDIVLGHQGGGGNERRWTGRMWLWPLPPPGPLTLAFEWADAGIEETTLDIDAAPLIEAGHRARELWPDDRPRYPKDGPAGAGWAAYG